MKKRPLAEIAAAIDAHLKRFETDPKINVRRDRKGLPDPLGLAPYYGAGAHYNGGSRISVCYIRYQGTTTLSRDVAERYLQKLDEGYVGRHYPFEKE